MNSMSEETKELLQEYIGQHGIPIILYISTVLKRAGCKVEPIMKKGDTIWDAAIKVSKDEDGEEKGMVSEFFFHNTFIETLCVDRDDDPLIFDPKILEAGDNIDYISGKIKEIVEGRTTLLLEMFAGKSVEEIYNDNPHMFERIRKKEVNADDHDGMTF